jgi:hypothetical protein
MICAALEQGNCLVQPVRLLVGASEVVPGGHGMEVAGVQYPLPDRPGCTRTTGSPRPAARPPDRPQREALVSPALGALPLNAVVFRVLQAGPECCLLLPVVPPGTLLGSGSAQSARFRASGRPAPTLATRTRVEDSCASFRCAISPRRADAGRLARKK